MKKQLAGAIALFLLSVMCSGLLTGCAGADASARQYKWLDIPYANVSASQKLDIYLPYEGKGPYPVIVSIHGGGYNTGDKVGPDLLSAWEGLKRGYAVVSVNYRLSGEAVFPAQINDIKAALRFIRANHREYNFDPDNIAVWGSSAGGALAALAGTTGDVQELMAPPYDNIEQSDRVQAVVDWCGPINPLTIDEQYAKSGIKGFKQNCVDSFSSKYMGKQITQVPDLVKKANPETYISWDDPPFLIQHGTADNWIPVQQSIDFAARLSAILGKDKVQCDIIQDAGHGGKSFNNIENVGKVLDFLDKYLK